MSPRRALALAVVGALLMAAGVFFVNGYQYGHLHRRIEEAYFEYLQDWERSYAASFAATEWSLEVEGLPAPLPLTPLRRPSKRVLVPQGEVWPPAGSPAAAAAAAGGAAAGGGGRWHRPAAQTSLLEFRLDGLLAAVFFPTPPPTDHGPGAGSGAAAAAAEADTESAAGHARLWRPVGQQLRAGRSLALLAREPGRGAVSRLELGRVAFVRTRSVPSGGEGRCTYDQRGEWQPDSTCTVHEYLGALCVKVARRGHEKASPAAAAADAAVSTDAASGSAGGGGGDGGEPGPYALDTALGGGPGCGAEWGWEAGQWRRLDARRGRLHGRLYLPVAARNATVVTVRHSHDPSVLEMEAVRRLAPNLEQQILMHAVGLALCFLGFVLLLSVAAFQAPQLLAAGKAALRRGGRRRRRGAGGAKDSDDDGLLPGSR